MLISPEYLEQNKKLHEDKEVYGTSSGKWSRQVAEIANAADCQYILDYGCGKGLLKQGLKNSPFVREYDPAIPGKDKKPEPNDMVVCTDVLEHIEPDCIDAVLDDLRRLTIKAGFFVIDTMPANKNLPDGRNAHLIQEGEEWWLPKIMQRFKLVQVNVSQREIVMVVKPK